MKKMNKRRIPKRCCKCGKVSTAVLEYNAKQWICFVCVRTCGA